ncbi:hypothetical protein [Enterococcus sp. UD-01]|jgi:hypothetical protein|uniref:hypothetical protein n=1 Tax=Enterococcus sp. UD-01 TaxID=3373911 RepID=UPI003838BBF6
MSIRLKDILKEYGFFCLEGAIPEKQAERFLYVKKQLQREDLIFQPLREVCFERMLSAHTSLYIEGLEHYDESGKYLGFFYDYYKATYIYTSSPSRLKIYGERLTRRELLQKLKGFSFLKEE